MSDKKALKAFQTTEGKIIRGASAGVGALLVWLWYRARKNMTPEQLEKDKAENRFFIKGIAIIIVLSGVCLMLLFLFALVTGDI